jgi:glycosyltransferase involved in cell wall biosynthesis
MSTDSAQRKRLRVVSFNQTGLGGVTTWNLRTADAFALRPELGIEFIAAESGRPEPLEKTLALMSPAGRERVSFIRAGLNTTRVAVGRWIKSNPQITAADIILPNHAIEGWVFAEMCWRTRGAQRPVAIAGIHSDEEMFYHLSGEEGPCDAVFAVSSYCVEKFNSRYPDRRPARFLPYGVPVSDDPKPRAQGGPLKLAYCGRLVRKQKRIYDMVPLVESLVRRGVDFELHLAGDGTERKKVLALLQEAGGERVIYHGRLSPMQMAEFWSDKHVFVQVSDFEGTSISMLESMAQGMAPVVTDVASGVRDVIEPGVSGYLHPIGDMEGMAATIERLSRDRGALARVGMNAWRRVREAYSLDASTRAMAEMFRESMSLERGPFHVTNRNPRVARLERLKWLPNRVVRGLRQVRKYLYGNPSPSPPSRPEAIRQDKPVALEGEAQAASGV